TIRRTLDAWGYTVEQVINITDFGHLVSDADEGEDKMTKGLKREGLALSMENMKKLAERYTDAFFADIVDMGLDTQKIKFPRASEYIAEQIALIKTLEQKGYAYRTSDGVYFDTSRFPNYGKLGHIDLSGQQATGRVEENSEKRSPHDFALWKLDSKLGWDSPWGKGFPGWHIECTAMIFSLLGRQIDIHTGGIDHIPVHHNNEIAQAEAITGKQYVRYWMHNEFITIESKRIGKSMGNAIVLNSIIDKGTDPRALRYWYLTAHYRTPMNFTWEALEGAATALGRLKRLYLELPQSSLPADERFVADFYAAMAEDLNTPRALARVWDMVRDDSITPTVKKSSLTLADKILGLGLGETGPRAKLSIKNEDLPEGIQELVAARESARANKDFEKADEIRKEIESGGFELKDTPEGPKVIKK
ncbi:MAG TPA: cysteine--tRNA ligase, partial [Candidatus Paceibacterota bacterium]